MLTRRPTGQFAECRIQCFAALGTDWSAIGEGAVANIESPTSGRLEDISEPLCCKVEWDFVVLVRREDQTNRILGARRRGRRLSRPAAESRGQEGARDDCDSKDGAQLLDSLLRPNESRLSCGGHLERQAT